MNLPEPLTLKTFYYRERTWSFVLELTIFALFALKRIDLPLSADKVLLLTDERITRKQCVLLPGAKVEVEYCIEKEPS